MINFQLYGLYTLYSLLHSAKIVNISKLNNNYLHKLLEKIQVISYNIF